MLFSWKDFEDMISDPSQRLFGERSFCKCFNETLTSIRGSLANKSAECPPELVCFLQLLKKEQLDVFFLYEIGEKKYFVETGMSKIFLDNSGEFPVAYEFVNFNTGAILNQHDYFSVEGYSYCLSRGVSSDKYYKIRHCFDTEGESIVKTLYCNGRLVHGRNSYLSFGKLLEYMGEDDINKYNETEVFDDWGIGVFHFFRDILKKE